MVLLAMEVASHITSRLHKAERTTVKVWNHLVSLGEWMTIIERWDPSRPGHRLLDVLKKEHKDDLLKVEKMVMPLLYNLMKNPEDVYIKWPNRKEIIDKQIKKIVTITRGK